MALENLHIDTTSFEIIQPAIDFCLRREGFDSTLAYWLCAPCLLGIATVGFRALRAKRKGTSLC